jgi:hypothetical protein
MPFLREHPELLAQFRAGVMAAFDAVYHAYNAMLDRLPRVAFKIKEEPKRSELFYEIRGAGQRYMTYLRKRSSS